MTCKSTAENAVLRDTGATYDVVHSSVVNSGDFTGGYCSVGVPPGTKRQPLHRIGTFQEKSKFRQQKNCRVYLGDLGKRGNRQEMEKAFAFYRSLRRVRAAQSPPGFAFVEFKDLQDAWDAVCALHGEDALWTSCTRPIADEEASHRVLPHFAR
ncbi:hypothetical protein HPB50_008690 [Hyalomma asiaticum]|uniref:Uncharacterized protein n=1 Tax=Hyalomma asiaticum TaxID=266040 RepID=A0ACB7RT75_HYAAI|nr:hypothetical protein HPB50_008690 [Hyalomma asiaticum]